MSKNIPGDTGWFRVCSICCTLSVCMESECVNFPLTSQSKFREKFHISTSRACCTGRGPELHRARATFHHRPSSCFFTRSSLYEVNPMSSPPHPLPKAPDSCGNVDRWEQQYHAVACTSETAQVEQSKETPCFFARRPMI